MKQLAATRSGLLIPEDKPKRICWPLEIRFEEDRKAVSKILNDLYYRCRRPAIPLEHDANPAARQELILALAKQLLGPDWVPEEREELC